MLGTKDCTRLTFGIHTVSAQLTMAAHGRLSGLSKIAAMMVLSAGLLQTGLGTGFQISADFVIDETGHDNHHHLRPDLLNEKTGF